MSDAGERLLAALHALPRSSGRDALIARAKKGEFHDFKTTELHPKERLAAALVKLRAGELAELVRGGAFADLPDAEDLEGLTRALRRAM